ncbi:MAG: Uma2 family endonuclease [Isosphaeraceae bacterium]
MSSVLASTTAATPSTDLDPRPRRWTREEFYRMAELGWFHGERAELIEGEIMVLSPQGPSHSYLTDHVAALLRESGWTSVWVRMQLPINFGPYSDPEPDVSVVMGLRADYRAAHPSSALLIVEVSDTTLIYDRGRKASLYAMRGVADYWIVNVNDDQLEIHRDPGADLAQPFGYGYASLTVHHRGEMVTPQAAPHLFFSVADLLG